MTKKTIERELEEFLQLWDFEQLTEFFRDVIPLFELFDCEDESDWVTVEVGVENEQNVRLVRTMYLISRIAEKHTAKLARMKSEHKGLFKRLEKIAEDMKLS